MKAPAEKTVRRDLLPAGLVITALDAEARRIRAEHRHDRARFGSTILLLLFAFAVLVAAALESGLVLGVRRAVEVSAGVFLVGGAFFGVRARRLRAFDLPLAEHHFREAARALHSHMKRKP